MEFDLAIDQTKQQSSGSFCEIVASTDFCDPGSGPNNLFMKQFEGSNYYA